MSERAYTVKEIDDMRRAIRDKWVYGFYGNYILDSLGQKG